MTNWQITAKTIFCEDVDDEVTIMLHKDSSVVCTGYKKYNNPNEITVNSINQKQRRLKRTIRCEGQNCPRVTTYKASILAEETR
jgi:hypothetical protein